MSRWKNSALGRTVRTWRGGLSLAVLVLIAMAALFAPWVAPYPYDIQNLSATNKDPSLAHWLGTDEFGRDVLSRIIYGARTSLTVALTAICGSVTLGMCLGAAAGYFGGLFDRAVTAVVDLTWSFPDVTSCTFSIDSSLSKEQSISILRIFSNFNDKILPTFFTSG